MATVDIMGGGFHSVFGSGTAYVMDDSSSSTLLVHGAGDIVHAGAGADNIFVIGGGAAEIHAGGGTDFISGGSGADHIFATTTGGTDALTGGGGADTFDFHSGAGTHTVTDFNAGQGDMMALAHNINSTGIVDQSTLTSYLNDPGHVTQVGANVMIDLGHGDTLQVNNASATDIMSHASNYFTVH